MLILHLQHIRANFRNVQLFSLKKTRGVAKTLWKIIGGLQPRRLNLLLSCQRSSDPRGGRAGCLQDLSTKLWSSSRAGDQGKLLPPSTRSKRGVACSGKAAPGLPGGKQDLVFDTSSSLLASKGPPGSGGDSTSHRWPCPLPLSCSSRPRWNWPQPPPSLTQPLYLGNLWPFLPASLSK